MNIKTIAWSICVAVATGCISRGEQAIEDDSSREATWTLASPPAPNRISTNFNKYAQLTRTQIKLVAALAIRGGIQHVAQISTHNIHPTPFFGISVRSQKEIKGRYVRSRSISVCFDTWYPKERTQILHQQGDFYTERAAVTSIFGIFEEDGNAFRVKLENDITVEEGDQILSAFRAGTFLLKTDLDRSKLRKPWQPSGLARSRTEGGYVAWYNTGKYSWRFVKFRKLKGGALVIHSITEMIS